jgi:hypothetical protein
MLLHLAPFFYDRVGVDDLPKKNQNRAGQVAHLRGHRSSREIVRYSSTVWHLRLSVTRLDASSTTEKFSDDQRT